MQALKASCKKGRRGSPGGPTLTTIYYYYQVSIDYKVVYAGKARIMTR